MKKPKISIVTPSFNQVKYLEKTIQSVLNQRYENLEYIIIDGGSSDGSIDIIKKYESSLMYWQSQSDQGQADAISQGFELATGDIFAWINSDDFYCRGALHKVAEEYTKHPSVGLIYGNSFLVDEKENLIRPLIACPMTYRQWIHRASTVFQGSVFFSRSAYDSVSGINPKLEYAMEYELFYKIVKQFQTSYIAEFIGCFRQQPQQKSATINDVGLKEIRNILLEIENIDPDSFSYNVMSKCLRVMRRLKYINLYYPTNEDKYLSVFNQVS